MIFYKKPKIYKNGNIRHGIVIIDGVKYTAEFVKPEMKHHGMLKDAGNVDILVNFDQLYDLFGHVLLNYQGLVMKLTKIE